MTTITMQATRLRTLGLVTVVASLIGAACAVVIIAWPPQVSDQWYSYPFDSTGAIADNATYNGQSIGFSLETQTRPLYSAVRSTSTIAHELAHQWFGDVPGDHRPGRCQ